MDLLRRFRVYTYVLVVLSVLGFTYAEANLPLLVLALSLTGLSWWLLETPNAKPFPRWIINIGVLVSSLVLFGELVIQRQENLLLALGHFMIIVLLCKLFETKANRDYAQILTLSLLIAVTGSIFSSTILFSIILAVYLSLGLYTVLLFHLRTETAQALAQQAPAVNATLPPDPTIRRDIRLITVGSGIILLLFAMLVFTLIPRDKGREILGTWTFDRSSSVTGFSDRISFGDFGRLQQSNALVMHVRLTQNGIASGSDYYQPYFRGLVLDTYDPGNRQWLRAHKRMRDVSEYAISPENEAQIYPPQRYSQNGLLTQRYTMQGNSSGVLFTLCPPSSVVNPPVNVRVFSTDLRTLAHANRDEMLTYHGVLGKGFEYEIDTPLLFKHEDDRPFMFPGRPGVICRLDVGEEGPPREIFVPPEIMELSRKVAGDLWPRDLAQMNSEQAIRLVNCFDGYLRDNYPYSLENRPVDNRIDPNVDFLLNRKQIGAHCEYFASALVMMCKSAGIPARLVTGFHGGEYNTLGGFYAVQQKYAHAWVEVYFPQRGWVLYDPTPPAREQTPSALASWGKWVREIYEVVERQWLGGFVTFDNNSRRFLSERLFRGVLTQWEGVREFVKNMIWGFADLFRSSTVTWWERTGIVAALVVNVGGVTWLVRRWHRRKTSPVRAMLRHLDRPTRKKLSADLAFYDDLQRLLRRHGIRRQSHLTPREYVELLRQNVPQLPKETLWLVDIFYELRFGSTKMSPQLRQQIAGVLRQLQKCQISPASQS